MRHAHGHAATLLERHLFLQHVSHAALRVLAKTQADQAELARTRRLFTAVQQAMLE